MSETNSNESNLVSIVSYSSSDESETEEVNEAKLTTEESSEDDGLLSELDTIDSGFENDTESLGVEKKVVAISKKSEYEMMRDSNIRERMEAFKDMFKEIGELKKSMIRKKPKSIQMKKPVNQPVLRRKSERILIQESVKESIKVNSSQESSDSSNRDEPKSRTMLKFPDHKGVFLPTCSQLSYLPRLRSLDPSTGRLLSNDLADLCWTQCNICAEVMEESKLLRHCKIKHQLTLQQYREQCPFAPTVVKTSQSCALCGVVVIFSHTRLAAHLRLKHAGVSLAEYQGEHCVDSRTKTRWTRGSRVDLPKLKREEVENIPYCWGEAEDADDDDMEGNMSTFEMMSSDEEEYFMSELDIQSEEDEDDEGSFDEVELNSSSGSNLSVLSGIDGSSG